MGRGQNYITRIVRMHILDQRNFFASVGRILTCTNSQKHDRVQKCLLAERCLHLWYATSFSLCAFICLVYQGLPLTSFAFNLLVHIHCTDVKYLGDVCFLKQLLHVVFTVFQTFLGNLWTCRELTSIISTDVFSAMILALVRFPCSLPMHLCLLHLFALFILCHERQNFSSGPSPEMKKPRR